MAEQTELGIPTCDEYLSKEAQRGRRRWELEHDLDYRFAPFALRVSTDCETALGLLDTDGGVAYETP